MAHTLKDKFEKKFTDGKKEVTLKFIPPTSDNLGRVEFHSPSKKLGKIKYFFQTSKKDNLQKPILYIKSIPTNIPYYIKSQKGMFKTANRRLKYEKVPTLAVQELEKLAKKSGVRSIAVLSGSQYWNTLGYKFQDIPKIRLLKLLKAFNLAGKRFANISKNIISRTHVKPLNGDKFQLTTQKRWKAVRRKR